MSYKSTTSYLFRPWVPPVAADASFTDQALSVDLFVTPSLHLLQRLLSPSNGIAFVI